MKKFIKNTANSIRANAIRLAATHRSGEGFQQIEFAPQQEMNMNL